MNHLSPVTLCRDDVKLMPLSLQHAQALEEACADGELWKLNFTSAPGPGCAGAYIQQALAMQAQGTRLVFAVFDKIKNRIIGTTSYHDILLAAKRLEIGYTWYAKSYQRSHINTTCKLMLMSYAFETLQVQTVGLRTDNINYASQAAIERLGAKKDGVIRGHAVRKDGSVRDTILYSITREEWPSIQAHLLQLLDKHRA